MQAQEERDLALWKAEVAAETYFAACAPLSRKLPQARAISRAISRARAALARALLGGA